MSNDAAVPMTRRGLLKKGLLGGALLAVGGAGFLALRSGKRVPLPSEPLQVLDATTYAVVHAIASRMIQPRAGWPTIDDLEVPLTFDRILRGTDPTAQAEVKQLLGLFENALANLAFGGRTRPFTALEPDEQDAVLTEWQKSSLEVRRTGFQAVRTLIMGSYYSSPKCWGAIRYPGPPGEARPEAIVWKGGGEPRPPSNGMMPPEEPR